MEVACIFSKDTRMKKPKNPYTNGASLVYDVPRWDEYQWKTFKNQSPDTQDVLKQGEDKLFAFPAFSKETFHRLYSHQPQHLPQVKPEHAWALKAHEQLDQVPDFDRLTKRCRGDRFLSGIAATAFSEKVMSELPEPEQPFEDPQPLRAQVRSLKAMERHVQEAGKQLPSHIHQMIDELVQQGKTAVVQAQEYADTLDESALRQVFRVACDFALEEVQRVTTQIDAFSFGNHSGIESTGGNIDEKLALAQNVQRSSKLQQIALEAGRLRRMAAQKQRSKADHARSEVSSIESGAELSRLLPAELIKLTEPALFGLFAKDYTERGLLQYELTGKEVQGRGPIVVCLDSSGSMEGEREVWSKAVALALLSIAVKQKRSCRLIHFTSTVERIDDFPAGQVDTSKLLESMEIFFDGGTSFEAPLRSALEAIRSEKDLKKADVVFITDGECCVSDAFVEEWQKACKILEFTTYAILLGCCDADESALAQVANPIIPILDLSDESAVTNHIFSI